MCRTLACALLLLCSVACRAHSQRTTRFGVLTAVLDQRKAIYEQNLVIDGCSITRMLDSVTTEVGTLGPAFANSVRGTAGNCMRQEDLPAGSARVLSGIRLVRGAHGFFPDIGTADAKEYLTLMVRIENRRSRSFVVEEWVIKPLEGGRLSVIAVRVGIGHNQ
jgi:hypothetical protein